MGDKEGVREEIIELGTFRNVMEEPFRSVLRAPHECKFRQHNANRESKERQKEADLWRLMKEDRRSLQWDHPAL